MTLLGREWWVIVCGWVDGGEAFVDLKEINAKRGSGFLRMGVFASSQVAASSFDLRNDANSASAEWRSRDGYEGIGQRKVGDCLRMGW
jgi:hypothetical protein